MNSTGFVRLLSAALAALLWSACGESDALPPAQDASDVPDVGADVEDPDGDGPLEWLTLEYALLPHTVLMEGDLLDAIQSFDGVTLVVRKDGTAEGEIAQDRVLLTGISDVTPVGLMHRVVSVEEVGELLNVQLAPVSLPQTFERLDLDMGGRLPSALLGAGGGQKADIGGTLPFPLGGPVDWLVFDGDGDPTTTEDNVRVHGDVVATIAFTFRVSFDVGGLDGIDLTSIPPDINPVDIDLEVSLDLDIEAEADVTAEGQASLSFSKTVPIGEVPLPPIGVWPLVFVPVLQAEGTIEGGAAGSFAVRTGVSGGLGGGVTFSADDGISNEVHPPTWAPGVSTADGQIRASLRASVDVELALLLGGIVGPKAGVSVFAGVDADIQRTPCWRAEVGMDALAGLLIELFSVDLVNWEKRWPIGAQEVASGSCPIGESIDPPPPWSVTLDDTMSVVASTDTASSWLSRAIDGNMLVAGRGSRGLFKVTPEGEPVWARGFTPRDTVLPVPLQVTAAVDRADTGLLATTDQDVLLWLDAAGRLEDARRVDVGATEALAASGAVRTASGTILVVTPVRMSAGAPREAALLRVHPGGAIDAWRWGSPAADDVPWHIVPWGDGYALVVTSWDTAATPARRSHVLVLDADGQLERAWTLEPCAGDQDLFLRTGAETEDGALILAGWQRFDAPRGALVRLDVTGDVDWTTLNRSTSLLGFDITGLAQLEGGAWFVVGTRWLAAPDDAFVARTDSAGRFIFARRLGGSESEVGPAVLDNGDGSVTVSIPTESLGGEHPAWWLLRLDPRFADVELDGGPLSIAEDAFVAEDGCTVSTAAGSATTPLQVDVTAADVDATAL